jgi:hypothetical protein
MLRTSLLCTTIALAGVVAACARDNPAAPRPAIQSGLRANIDPSTPFPYFGAVKVCNLFFEGQPGAGTYQVTVNGVTGAPVSLPNDVQCAVVWQASGDGAATINVTQIGSNCTMHLAVRDLDASGEPILIVDDFSGTNTYTATVTTTNGLSNTGFAIWFQNGSGGCNPPPPVCEDQHATNFGGPLPCVYPGKTFTIGPSSMEGAIKISAGDWVNGGYSFKFNSAHTATTFTVTAFVTITGPCLNSAGQKLGFTDVMTVPLGTVPYAIPTSSNATDWLPTGDANNVLSWEGSVVAPAGLCGGGGNKLDASKGAVYTATVSQVPPSGSLVNFRFKYRDPAAKGKPNTNCLDTTDPNRARADVCGASWSQTVTDP